MSQEEDKLRGQHQYPSSPKTMVLFRKSLAEKEEVIACQHHFFVTEQRMSIPPGCLVIGRYSVLPYYLELERDLELIDSRLINTYEQHRWIANFEWYEEPDIQGFTPRSWDDTNFYTAPNNIEYVVKGRTNSRKYHWNTQMHAKDKREALEISMELAGDSLIGPQGIIYREYVPLKTFEVGLNGIPYTNEYRFFFYGDCLLSHGYYWSSAMNTKHYCDFEGIALAHRIANIAKKYANFFVLDIAQTKNGGWILIEINDGQMSGPSECDVDQLYKGLAACVKNH